MSDAAVLTKGLTKVYKGELGQKGIVGLKDLNCLVEKGEVYAFLGPNGAGKTTTIKLLTRLLHPSKGRIEILGRDNRHRDSMNRVGYMPEQPNIYGYLRGIEFLNFMGRLFGLDSGTSRKRIPMLMERVGLARHGDLPIRNYSRGMMQRLGFAQALVNDPDLLILDEPMASLDPLGRKDVRDLILELKAQGKTIFFSSHILSDAEMIADRVSIINQGSVVKVGRLHELVASQISSVEVTFSMPPEKSKRVRLPDGIRSGDNVLVRLNDADEVSDLLQKLQKSGARVVSVVPQKKSLEEAFMDEVKR